MQVVTVNGGNLFQLASVYLGDATQWVRIASLNDVLDPFLQGLVTLNIPDVDPEAGGGIGQQ
jgi:nucleoid-associated protein YgaU